MLRAYRSGGSYCRRAAVISIETLLRIARRRLNMLRLHRGGRYVPLIAPAALLNRRRMIDAVRSARIGHAIVVDNRRVMHNRRIHIRVVNERWSHMHHGSVIEKAVASPFAAGKTDAHVTEAIVHASVVADVRAPVSSMKDVRAAFKTPVGRRPKQAWLRSRHPCAWNPVVALRPIRPISRRPQVPFFRAGWLFIHRKHRWSNIDADKNSGIRRRRNQRKHKRDQRHTR